jgi:IS1 family transposase
LLHLPFISWRWRQDVGFVLIVHHAKQLDFVGMSASAKAIISYRTGKRDCENTDLFIQDLRQRVIGAPEISTDGFLPYTNAIRDVFNGRASHGVIVKTYSVTNLAVKDAARRYSLAEAVAVSRDVVSGIPTHISTSYVERQNGKQGGETLSWFSRRYLPTMVYSTRSNR